MNFGYLNQPRLDDTLVIDLLDPVSLTRFEYNTWQDLSKPIYASA